MGFQVFTLHVGHSSVEEQHLEVEATVHSPSKPETIGAIHPKPSNLVQEFCAPWRLLPHLEQST